MSKHTPGPWVANIGKNALTVSSTVDGSPIGETWRVRGGDVDTANARLIAADDGPDTRAREPAEGLVIGSS